MSKRIVIILMAVLCLVNISTALEPVANWPLDDGAGTVAADVVGGNDGTLIGGVTWLADGGAAFDNIDGSHIEVPHADVLDFADESFTISMLVRYDAHPGDTDRWIIKGTHGDPGTGSRYEIFQTNGDQIRFAIDNGPDNLKSSLRPEGTNAAIITGDWVHVVAVRDAENDLLSLYADGVLLGTLADTSGDISSGEDMWIGESTDEETTAMAGDMRDIRIYDVALTEDDIAAIYPAAAGLGATAAYSLDTSMLPDETWDHDNNSDQWDGTGIGEGNPGGISAIDGYLRIQETGDPREHGFPDPGSNRKIYLAHDIGPDGASPTILDDGVTLFFRMRLATDGPLDQIHPDGGGDIVDVPATGDGYLVHDSGTGSIGIFQAAGGQISFTLTTAEENGIESGLHMNNLNGAIVSGDVDWNEDGTLNLLPLDPTVWHDFLVTIQADTSGVGTHQVDISVDGAPAQTFLVTAGGGVGVVYEGISYLSLGLGNTAQSGAIDVAALEFAPGIIMP